MKKIYIFWLLLFFNLFLGLFTADGKTKKESVSAIPESIIAFVDIL